MSRLPFGATSGYPISYSGCLRRLSVNQHQIVLNNENILSARNVIDCDGTPCGGEVCHHGGTCWYVFISANKISSNILFEGLIRL